ncbi:MAG: hypothetical protein C0403_10455 [Desulfobacterium sp.]|nr:hypothetical protein [Desulfobacterium sp.]
MLQYSFKKKSHAIPEKKNTFPHFKNQRILLHRDLKFVNRRAGKNRLNQFKSNNLNLIPIKKNTPAESVPWM